MKRSVLSSSNGPYDACAVMVYRLPFKWYSTYCAGFSSMLSHIIVRLVRLSPVTIWRMNRASAEEAADVPDIHENADSAIMLFRLSFRKLLLVVLLDSIKGKSLLSVEYNKGFTIHSLLEMPLREAI